MYRWLSGSRSVLILLSLLAAGCTQESGYAGIGRSALPEEIGAWNIDVRPDFEGLPSGSGTVARGQLIWDEKCTSCHGIFGESTEVYRPIVGGTTENDIETGYAMTLASDAPLLTTLSKLSTLSTLWDYIHRAMPWTEPKSLSHDDVYALVAYILHLGNIVPSDFVLSESNIKDVQKLLPNRHGATPHQGLWDVGGVPDVRNIACMSGCPTNATITSEFPKRALAASGNPAEQNRPWGAIRGVNSEESPDTTEESRITRGPRESQPPFARDLAQNAGCFACHATDRRTVGPSFTEIASKYGSDVSATAYLMGTVKAGGSGVWGVAAMPPQQIDDETLTAVIEWIQDGAGLATEGHVR